MLTFGPKKRPNWVLECDIENFFDRISHTWLIDNIPMNKMILKQFLEAGFIEPMLKEPTFLDQGVPQGGVISPLFSNIVLNGLEGVVKSALSGSNLGSHKTPKVFVVR